MEIGRAENCPRKRKPILCEKGKACQEGFREAVVIMRVNIWIPDDLVDEIREYAHKAKESVSGYLVGLHRANMGYRDSAKPAQPEKMVEEGVNNGKIR